ncbi:hypothetical protein DICPUDRAFT_81817 [Dictyostelium purpureum]|uniref:Uncharacterized protein n=1 Tax=Dictyostelium purpureum TaxID=5786 RepID=F0ZUP0_DICPU|nr:uncharacterized protein DICPUDRAFT_81817 [Dictyostelium purpureum]EGC32329.1 hypothetical protein DICPUDRAFT_81817 [Dictyostelium purpureum]|eukprot:XP_003291131.1 hypothetical protein DICPUDRAFT_81817 [Dictyostelium purpureum]
MGCAKITGVIALCLTILFTGLTIYYGFKFFNAYELGKSYEETLCTVEKKVDSGLCNVDSSSECYKQNDDIWWYNNWGSNPWIIINGGGYSTGGGNYDGGDDDDDDDDDGEYDEGGRDTGEYDDDDDGGDDEGGEDVGGDAGGDDDIMREYAIKGYKKEGATSGAGDLSNLREFKNIKKSLKQKMVSEVKAKNIVEGSSSHNSSSNNFSGSVNNSSSSFDSNSYSGCSDDCYQGIFTVIYNVGNGTLVNSTIKGLVSVESDWVKAYLNNYHIGYNYTCWYSSRNVDNVVWFKPPKIKSSYLAGFVIDGILALISVIVAIFMVVRICHHHRHHHGYESINH